MQATSASPRVDGLSRAQLLLIGSAALLIIAFVLPWANTGTSNPGGLALASQPAALEPLGLPALAIAPWLYLVPILAAVALGLAFIRRAFAGPIAAAMGLGAFALLIVLLLQINQAPVIAEVVAKGGWPLSYYGFGLWLALLAVIGIPLGGMLVSVPYLAPSAELTTRRIVTAGVLGAIAIVLGVTRLGFIPVPNATGNATIMHIPAIIGGVLEGPVVGILTGGIFGIFSMLQDTTGLFSNPLVSVVPRLLIGLIAWLTYRSLKGINIDLAAAVAGVVGTLTNTVGVVGMLVILGLIPVAVIPTIIPQAIAELVIAAIITPIVARSVNVTRSGRTVASETGPREKSYY